MLQCIQNKNRRTKGKLDIVLKVFYDGPLLGLVMTPHCKKPKIQLVPEE